MNVMNKPLTVCDNALQFMDECLSGARDDVFSHMFAGYDQDKDGNPIMDLNINGQWYQLTMRPVHGDRGLPKLCDPQEGWISPPENAQSAQRNQAAGIKIGDRLEVETFVTKITYGATYLGEVGGNEEVGVKYYLLDVDGIGRKHFSQRLGYEYGYNGTLVKQGETFLRIKKGDSMLRMGIRRSSKK